MPTLNDRYDLPQGTSSSAAVAAYDEGLDMVLAKRVGVEDCFARAVAEDDGFALAHAALAMKANDDDEEGRAKQHISRAETLADGLGRRERQHVTAIATIVNRDAPRALSLLQEHLVEFPRDVLLLQALLQRTVNTNKIDTRTKVFALLREMAQHYEGDWWFLSVYGFVHEESGLFDEALRLSERALALRPDSAMAAHGKAHVHYETNDHETGAAFMTEWLSDHASTSFLGGHLTWHHVLHELALGHRETAVSLYEQMLNPSSGKRPTALLDAASILWRWQIYGLGEGAPVWEPVVALAKEKTPRGTLGDAHAALAFAGSGDEEALTAFLENLRERAAGGNTLVSEVSLPLAEGVTCPPGLFPVL